MTINIRPALRSDVPAILGMMRGFAEFEKLLDSFKVTEQSLASVIFGPAGFVECLIAEEGESTVGYMIFYPCFASFSGQMGLYLEDIYIKPTHRGRGVGEAMLRKLVQIAMERGCERIDFQVLDWNIPAIGFYQNLGAVRNDDERHFKFSGKAFEKLSR